VLGAMRRVRKGGPDVTGRWLKAGTSQRAAGTGGATVHTGEVGGDQQVGPRYTAGRHRQGRLTADWWASATVIGSGGLILIRIQFEWIQTKFKLFQTLTDPKSSSLALKIPNKIWL
jgi:hypothetical protein